MKTETVTRRLRLVVMVGALALMLGAGAKIAPNSHRSDAPTVTISSDVLNGSLQIADGSESTGGGKPKPHG